MPHTTPTGFTLLELSIVLVVIGLIVGGVLVGRDLIQAAELRSILTQLERYDTAVMAFKLKYGCMPGDCASAESFGLGDATCPAGFNDSCTFPPPAQFAYAGCNGNDNGILDGSYACPENLNLWYHLHGAGLIGDPADGKTTTGAEGFVVYGVSAPLTRLRGVGILAATLAQLGPEDGTFYIIGYRETGGSGYYDLMPDEAFYLDLKKDDGLPLSGGVTISSPYVPNAFDCIANGQYNMVGGSSAGARCSIRAPVAGFNRIVKTYQ